MEGRVFKRKHKRLSLESSRHLSRCQTQRTQIENTHLRDCITVAIAMRSDSWQTGGNWSSSFLLWCQTERWTANGVLLLPQRVDRGSQRAVLQPCANLISDARMWGKTTKSFPDASCCYGNSRMCQKSLDCVCSCLWVCGKFNCVFADDKREYKLKSNVFHFISMSIPTRTNTERHRGPDTPFHVC